MEYITVFDVAQSGYRHVWFPLSGIPFVALGALLFFLRKTFPRRSARLFAYFLFSFASLWTLGSFIGTWSGYWSLSSALRSGRCDVVEGEVADFRPMPSNGHGLESFAVGGTRFEYSDFVLTPGFNHTTYRGGPIKEGLHVRIHYRRGDIARLEIAKSSNT